MILCRGVAQVMLQESPLTGVLFLAGILAGSSGYGGSGHMAVFVGALGALLLVIPISGDQWRSGNYVRGLYGFNDVLVGCAVFTF
ncbi:MAG: urea transporter, partial [Muribaculaceae bacterium]|nr:urea transporter [Muribaculaceae bacterium]